MKASRIDQLTRLVFPKVYGEGSQDNEVAKEIFRLMVVYAEDKDECILKSNTKRMAVLGQLTKASPDSEPSFNSLAIKFLCKYGCAIKITKDKEHSPINIQIISLEQWEMGAHSCTAKKLKLLNAGGQSSLYAPTLFNHSQDLTTFSANFERRLEHQFQRINARQLEKDPNFEPQHTLQEVQQACKLAIQDYTSYYDKDILNKKEEKKEKKSAKTIGQSFSLNKNQADTAWFMARAMALELLGTQREQKLITQTFIIGFKGHLLKQATAEKQKINKYQREEVEKYKSSLDEIINQYKQKISSRSKNVDKFIHLTKAIEKNIIGIKGGKLTSSIQDRKDFYKKLGIELKQPAFMVHHQQVKHQRQKIEEKVINQYPVEVNSKYAFQELIKLHNILDSSNQSDINKWILLTEKTIWSFANQLGNDKSIIDLNIHMRQIECQRDASIIGSLLTIYQSQINENLAYYGMQLAGQARSHIQLIRAIAAIIVFESVKLNRQNRGSNLAKYRVPIDIDDLYSKFHSNSTDARNAMRQLKVYHSYRKERIPIFQLNEQSSTFYEFAEETGKETRSAQIWKQSMDKLLSTQRQAQLYKLHVMLLQSKANNVLAYVSRTPQLQSTYITNAFNQTLSIPIQSPCQYYPKNKPWLFAFLNNIPPDVLGMIKMLHFAQNPTSAQTLKETENLMFVNKIFQNEEFPINIFAKKRTGNQNLTSQAASKQQVAALNPQNQCSIYCGKSLSCSKYDLTQFYEEKSFNIQDNTKALRYYLNPPNKSQMNRQHEVYANLYQKPEEIQLESYEAMCNVRSAEHTQLILLCSGILERKIIADSYDQKPLLAQRLILQTGGKISTYHKETEKYFKKAQKLILQFMNVWAYSDTHFCPIIAPLVTFFAHQIVDDGLVTGDEAKKMLNVYYELSKKCLEEFKRVQKELAQQPGQKLQWDQRFTCMAAICCFREVELSIDQSEQIIFLLEMIFRLRVTKILSDREERPVKKRLFEDQLQYSIQKAIFRNIEVISNYINTNQDKLSDIVKTLDDSFPEDVKWTQVNLFHFRGQSEESKDIYQLNIYRGFIYKNGKQIACLEQNIKANPYYIQIFGKQRDFQVFPSHYPKYVRTKDNFNNQFKINEEKGKIYFEFSEDGKEIRHIVKKEGKKAEEQIWTLIERQKMVKSQCHIPKIFIDEHLSWYSDKRKCIAFRRPKFENLFEIGMVVFLQIRMPLSKIIAASHITYNNGHNNQDLDEICNSKNQNYQELILRNSNTALKALIPFKVLSKLQLMTYIIELRNRKTDETRYWLHRYLLKFKVTNESRLLSETYFGYALDYSYHDAKNCLFNKFPCLVLQKYLDSPTILNNHKRILLISNGEIQDNGTIDIPNESLQHVQTFKYDVHDFFGDVRGASRQSLLHLAALMLSINDNIQIESIEMTPLQYAMYLMKSCFTNRPFSNRQSEKLDNILTLGSTEVVLLGEALWKTSCSLSQILPFSSNTKQRNIFSYYKNSFLKGRTIYSKNYNSDQIRFREKINKNLLDFLGLRLPQGKKRKVQSTGSQSDQFEIGGNYWKGYPHFTGKNMIDSLQEIKKKFQAFIQSAQKLNFWNQKALKQVPIAFPSELEDLSKKHSKDEMMKEMILQLSESYRVYWQQQSRIIEIAEKIAQNEKKNQIKLIETLKSQALLILKQIQNSINEMKTENETHPDVITGNRPTLTPAMYTSILCEKDIILEYYPDLDKGVAKLLKETIKIWLELKTRTASFERTEQLLAQEKVDVVAVMREVLSPRSAVFQKNEWLCFQAQMKVQLWPSQLETYNNLMNGASSGSFCQLNMGEGKTQVIIPLIILNTIYTNSAKQGRSCLPRINLLSSLFQEARGNFFRFISATGFQIPAFEIPFNRKVRLVKNSINAIKHLIDSFSNKAYILMTRESRLSEILRFHEGKIVRKDMTQNPTNISRLMINKNGQRQFDFSIQDCKKPFIQNDIFDVFDQIDALMNCKKSYIFSIGEHLDLAHNMLRFEVIRLTLEIFLKKYLTQCLKQKIAVSDETDEDAIQIVQKGEFPTGLRLTLQNVKTDRIILLRKYIAKTILFQCNRHEYSFVNLLITDKQRQDLTDYIINPEKSNKYIPVIIPQASRPQIYLLRGILAYGIFQHCLSMRCGVDFGAPNEYHIKRIAVPYEAADIPSKTSEYEQPDVSTLLSYVAYFTNGLNEKYFNQCLVALRQLSDTSKQIEYGKWVQILDDEARNNFELKTVQKINYNSKAHKQLLYSTFKKNRRTVAFWLIKCVFLKDLKQFQKSICSSAWDLADVKKSVGFSGTKDNRWLYSNQLTWKPCQTPEILGTDGKMIQLISKHTKQVVLIEQNSKTLWQRFVDLALQKKVGCIIDAGAICVGKSLRDQIVPWIAEHQKFDSNRFLGISFCDNNGQWLIYDIEGKFYIPRGTTIPDHQTFVVFDQARTRGADLKMDGDIVAALSLGPELTKDSLMQAAGRLRKLGRNQSLIIMATHEVFSHLDNFPKDVSKHKGFIAQMNAKDQQKLPKMIMAWCCQNSIKGNHDLLMQFADLGWKYIHSKVNQLAFEQPLTTNLQTMYSDPLLFATVSELGNKAKAKKGKNLIDHPSGKYICQLLDKYGKTVMKQVGSLDDVCQREVQAEKQQQKEQEDKLVEMTALNEVDRPKILSTIPFHPFIFDSKFKMTSNFIETTTSQTQSQKIEIPQLYFVKIRSDQVLAVSIREASNFIYRYIIKNQKNETAKIFMLNSLNLESDIIKKNQLGGALVSAKFLTGIENYNPQEENFLVEQLIQSIKSKKEWKDNYSTVVSLFLKLKRVYLKKFEGSTLKNLILRLQNEA